MRSDRCGHLKTVFFPSPLPASTPDPIYSCGCSLAGTTIVSPSEGYFLPNMKPPWSKLATSLGEAFTGCPASWAPCGPAPAKSLASRGCSEAGASGLKTRPVTVWTNLVKIRAHHSDPRAQMVRHTPSHEVGLHGRLNSCNQLPPPASTGAGVAETSESESQFAILRLICERHVPGWMKTIYTPLPQARKYRPLRN